MAENTGTPAPHHQAATPPADYRPRPRYGELAPEGWTWSPPQDASAPAAPAASESESASAAPVAQGSAEKPVPAPPGWDRPVTLGLLILGLLATFVTIAVLDALPQAVQMLYTQEGLGDYSPAPIVATMITAGSISQAIVWLVTAAVSILLLVRSRRAFYVPLIGGVVAFVLIFVFMTIIVGSDSTLIDFYSRP
ncbi:hypothetical protein PA27867_2326 [Cryobacterium arcticum]|uniref:Uncharacterized protein n=2 Tax=Cryobacterium arcticum TaxID=670052 RepID=A0A1B1BKU5_9MICO|nr:hypothetical protein PA27867_2326 [Cryobacterium arcticum]